MSRGNRRGAKTALLAPALAQNPPILRGKGFFWRAAIEALIPACDFCSLRPLLAAVALLYGQTTFELD
jgi:hypothetical protein